MSDKKAWAFEGRVLEWLPKSEALDDTDVCSLRTDTENYSQLETFPIRYLEDALRGSVGKNVRVHIAIEVEPFDEEAPAQPRESAPPAPSPNHQGRDKP